MNINKILITGANGMLGSSMCPVLIKEGYEVIPTNKILSHLDICNYEELERVVKEVQPDIIFHLAAETDVDRCELEPIHAYQVNMIGTKNIAILCKKYNIPLLYVSTIGVFSGNKVEPYIEDDEAIPVNVYGWSKLAGEKVIKENLDNYYIVRAGWMIGGGVLKDKKFVGKVIKQIREGKIIKAVYDRRGSPTYTVDFSKQMSLLISKGKYGVYNCTNKGFPTRYDVAKKIIEYLGVSNKLLSVDSSHFPLPAIRAYSEMSINRNLEKLGICIMRNWEVALEDYLKECWL